MKTPIRLFNKGEEVAIITEYFYETPIAGGRVQFKSSEFQDKMQRVNQMRRFELTLEEQELSDDEEDALLEEKLEELSLGWDDISLDEGDWTIKTADSENYEIGSVAFDSEGYVSWRFY